MKKQWRPEGWKNPYLQQDIEGNWVDSRCYEAGADAMIEILKEHSKDMPAYVRFIEEPKGTWVFIPDGDEE